jgi:hypothetical protein
MKTSKFVLSILLLSALFCNTAFGQTVVFKVLANKGVNEVKSGDTWTPLKTGSALKDTDEIKISPNCYLGLVHAATGKPLEIKEPKIYKVTELLARVGTGATVLQKYTDFILSSNSPEAKKNRLSATGAVHRGETLPIHLLLPENQHAALFNNTAVISWENTKVAGPYVLTVMNMFDEPLDQIVTPETSYMVNFSNPKYINQSALIVQVSSKADADEVSKAHLIKRLSPSEQENIRKSLDEISSELNEPTALNKLILAGFYEENRLLIDAITAYEEAIKLAPDVPSYQEAFDEFLLRNGIVR